MIFRSRSDAGRRLAERLAGSPTLRSGAPGSSEPVLLGLPRGGVPVAAEAAIRLGLVLDVLLVRKLAAPSSPEFALGAIGEDGVRLVEEESVLRSGLTAEELMELENRERGELARRAAGYRGRSAVTPLTHRTALVIDDGIATGATARVACRVARARGAERVILAVPVAPPRFEIEPGVDADDLVCLARPAGFMSVGQWYSDFRQTSDREVLDCLARLGRTS